MAFYVDVLGFALSDYIEKPFRAYFFHINARHHSLALIETGRNGMHHLMVELFSLDDVGQSYDIALTQADRVNVTLGRHTNDLMTSFYAKSPSSFMIECGWGGREIEPATWKPFEMHAGPSLWGHERVWLPPADREGRPRNAHARRSFRPARAGSGDGRQLQTDVGHVCVVGRGEGLNTFSRRPCERRDPNAALYPVIASEAKQSIARLKERMDCFVALFLAMTRKNLPQMLPKKLRRAAPTPVPPLRGHAPTAAVR